VQTAESQELAASEGLVEQRTVGNQERGLRTRATSVLPGGSLGNTSFNAIIRRGRGSRIWDVSGNEYVDYLLGSGPMLIGHSHPDVVAAVVEQAELGATFFAMNEQIVALAEAVVDAVACADEVRFVSSGSEATLYAMRVARAFRKRDKILKFEGGFHGMNDYALVAVMPGEPTDFPHGRPDSAGVPQSIASEMLVAPFNDIETTSAIVEKHHDEIAGVIVEPFQRVIAPVPGFLEGLRELTHQYRIPLIFDEIVTGFRFAYGGAQEYYGVTPDLCTLGKALAGGFALAAVTGRSEIMEHFDRGRVSKEEHLMQVGTLSGNPVAAAAGLATLKVLRQEGTYERLFATGRRIRESLQQQLDQAEIPAQVVGEDPLFDVYFTDREIVDYHATLSADEEKSLRFTKLLQERGVFKGEHKYYVSTAHGDDDVELTADAFASAIEEL
jgi:glutamate-1-semialdehyde 2,1-aminomutase